MLVNGNRIDGVPTLGRLTEYVEAELAAPDAAAATLTILEDGPKN
jgi:hypothetical protein